MKRFPPYLSLVPNQRAERPEPYVLLLGAEHKFADMCQRFLQGVARIKVVPEEVLPTIAQLEHDSEKTKDVEAPILVVVCGLIHRMAPALDWVQRVHGPTVMLTLPSDQPDGERAALILAEATGRMPHKHAPGRAVGKAGRILDTAPRRNSRELRRVRLEQRRARRIHMPDERTASLAWDVQGTALRGRIADISIPTEAVPGGVRMILDPLLIDSLPIEGADGGFQMRLELAGLPRAVPVTARIIRFMTRSTLSGDEPLVLGMEFTPVCAEDRLLLERFRVASQSGVGGL